MLGLRTLIFDVDDLAGARDFYVRVLEKEPYFDQPFYVGFDVAGYELGLRPREGTAPATPGNATTYLGVDDVPATVERLLELGATIHEKVADVGEGIIVASVVDPFGNILGLIRNPGFAPPLTDAAANDVDERSIVVDRVVPLPRARVWSLWSSSEGITSWLTNAKVDLRPGGRFELEFAASEPIGRRGSERCVVLSFVRGRMLSFTWNAPPTMPYTRPRHTWVVVELSDAPKDSTRVVLTHTGWPASGLRDRAEWRETQAYFESAWPRVLDALERFARDVRAAREN